MRRHPSFHHKSAAIFLSLSLVLFNSVSFAAPVVPHALNQAEDSSSPLSIPEGFGKIEESFAGNPNKTIVYIQDAHDSLEAQENIAKLINHFVEHYGVKTVFEEGYEGPVPTDEYFGFIKDPKVREKVSYFLMDKLRLGGAEYAHINRTKDFQLIGADSIKLHLENITWYQKMSEHKEETERDLETIFTEIKKLANQHFPKELKEWLKLKERFNNHTLNLLEYLKRTKSLWLKSTSATEFQASSPALDLLLSAEDSKDKGVIEKVKSIDYRTLFQEIDHLENDYARIHLTTARDQKIFGYYKGLQLLKRLSDIQLSSEEYEIAKTTLQELRTEELAQFLAQTTKKSVVLSKRWEENIQNAIQFYETAQSRDVTIERHLDQFVEKSDEGIAILVFGGFHKNQITEILKRKKLSHLIISPRINQLDGRHKDYYRQLMSVGHLPFEIPLNISRASRVANFYEGAGGGRHPLAKAELRIISKTVQRGLNLDFPILDRQIIESLAAFHRTAPKEKDSSIRSEVRVRPKSEIPRLSSDRIPVSIHGMEKAFVGDETYLLRQFQSVFKLPHPRKSTEINITSQGVRFQKALSGPHTVWSFASKDIPRIARITKFQPREQLRKSDMNDIVVSEGPLGLAKGFVGHPNFLIEQFQSEFKLPDARTSRGNKIVARGITFEKVKSGVHPRWAFRKRDIPRVGRIAKFQLKEALRKLGDDDIEVSTSRKGFTKAFIGDPRELLQSFQSVFNLPNPRTSKQAKITRRGIVFEKVRSVVHTVWSFKEEDKRKVSDLIQANLQQDQDIEVRIEELGLAEVVALLGHDPLKLQQYIRLYYPELSQEEIDRLVVTSIRGLGGEGIEEDELHLNYEETLSAPTVEQDVKTTKGHSFVLSGRASAEASYIQVVGAYTRRIVVRQDRTFSATIPLPKTGEVNGFEVYAFNPETETKSPSLTIQVRQTGEKEDLEESFLRLLALREEVLESILKEPGRYQFLLRSVEQSLLKNFTYSDEAGLRYLRQRIQVEKSRSKKTILHAILRKFEEIKDMKFTVKRGERLYFFQKYTIYEIRKLMEQGVKGVIIANEQGLGKTITALEAIDGNNTVILTPNSVVSTWAEEDEKFFPKPNLEVLEGDYQERMKALTQIERPYLVTNIEFTRGMSPRRATLLSRPEGVLIVDEGDYLGSKTSQQSQGTRQIEAGFRLLLTATPFKRVSQIGYILGFLYPTDPKFNSARAFARAFPTDKKEALNSLFVLMNQHTIRIRKKDVFDTYDINIPLEEQSDRLPRKTEILPQEEGQFYLTDAQAKSILELFTQYQRWNRKHRGHESTEDKQYYRYKEGYFSKKEALRQIMNDPAYIGRPDLESPKHLAVDKVVEKELAHDPHKKMLIFTRYRAQVEEYLRRYAAYGARAYYGGLRVNANGYKIDPEGKVLYYKVDEYKNFILENGEFIPSDKAHGRPIRALDYEKILFQNNPASRVMVASYDTGALGVTFTAADVVVFDDLAPTYRDQYQAADRAHRIDNKRKKYEVKYYWLQALYPQSFLDKLDRETRENYFSMGTFDQIHFENLKRQASIFHRVMDGVGSEHEVARLHQRFMSERMPFLFATEQAENEINRENETQPGRAEVRLAGKDVSPNFKVSPSLNNLQGKFTVFADLDDVANLTDEQLTQDYEKIALRHKNVSFVFYNDQKVISKETRQRLEKLQEQLGSHRIQITQDNAQSVFTRQWVGELIHVSKKSAQPSLRGRIPDEAEAIPIPRLLRRPYGASRNDIPIHRFRYLRDETGVVPVALLYINQGNKGFENKVIDLSMVDQRLVLEALAYQASLVFARAA